MNEIPQLKIFTFEPKKEVRDQSVFCPVVILEVNAEEAFKQMNWLHINNVTIFEPRDWEMYEKPAEKGQCLIVCGGKKSSDTIKHDTMALWKKLITAKEI